MKEMDKEQESKITKGLFLGFVAGGIVGAVVALLYAPKPGKELRKDLRVQKDKLVDKATDFLNATAEAGEDFINEVPGRSREIITAAREKANSILENAEKTLSDAKTKAAVKIDTVKTAGTKVQSAAKAGMDAFRDELKNS